LWAVRDVDVKQSVTQKARGVGDVVVRVQHSDYTGRSQVALESVEKPREVRDLLNGHAQTARLEYQRRSQTHVYEGSPISHSAPASASSSAADTPAATSPGPSVLVGHLKELAQLRDDGILTEDEFLAQKTKLLNG
jgi:hypothetical protein